MWGSRREKAQRRPRRREVGPDARPRAPRKDQPTDRVVLRSACSACSRWLSIFLTAFSRVFS